MEVSNGEYFVLGEGRMNSRKTPIKDAPTKEERERRKKAIERRKTPEFMAKQQPKFVDGHDLASKMALYIAAQHEAEEPLTAAGCAIACGIIRKTMYNYGTGDYDGWCPCVEDEYRAQLDGEALFIYDYLIGGEHEGKKTVLLSDVVAHYNEIATAEREKRLYKRGSVADIFALKAQDGWQDDTNKGVTNQTLVITGGESAEAALKLLGYTKSE